MKTLTVGQLKEILEVYDNGLVIYIETPLGEVGGTNRSRHSPIIGVRKLPYRDILSVKTTKSKPVT